MNARVTADDAAYVTSAPLPPALTRRQAPPVVTATSRLVPPFITPPMHRLRVNGRATRGEAPPSRRDHLQTISEALGPAPSVRVSSPLVQKRPVTADAQRNVPEVTVERIARTLERIAEMLRTRGLAALSRHEADPLGQHVLRVISEHLAARGFG